MILWRYIGKEFLKFTSLIVFSFICIYLIIDFFEKNSRYFPRYEATLPVIAEFYLVQIPRLFVEVLPYGAMFGSLITLWMFARSGEISAMRAAGMSLAKIAMPLILLGLMLSGLVQALNEFVVPRASLRQRYIEYVKIEKTKPDMIFHESRWVRGSNSILYFKRLDQFHHALDKPEYFIFESPGEVKEFVYGKRATFDREKQFWRIENAVLLRLDSSGKIVRTKLLPTFYTNVSSQPPRILNEGVTANQVSYRELQEIIEHAKAGGGAQWDREVELYQKLSIPFASVLFILITLPFALRKERQADTYIGIVFVLLAAIVYSVGNMFMRSFAQVGWLSPILAAWAVNIVFVLVGVSILRRLDRGT